MNTAYLVLSIKDIRAMLAYAEQNAQGRTSGDAACVVFYADVREDSEGRNQVDCMPFSHPYVCNRMPEGRAA